MKGKKSCLLRNFEVSLPSAAAMRAAKDRGKKQRDVVPWKRFFWCTLVCVVSCVVFTGFTFSSFRLIFGKTFPAVVVLKWRGPALESMSGDSPLTPTMSVRETVMLPDHAVVFLDDPPSGRLFTKEDLDCVYFTANSSEQGLREPPVDMDADEDYQIVRCALPPRGLTVSVALKSHAHIPAGPTSYRWDWLVYEAVIDRDNNTVVFMKGLNLRADKLSNPSRYQCVYGWDFNKPKLLLRSDVVSIAQEIVRCKTPLSVLTGSPRRMRNNSIKVSVRVKGRGTTLDSIARPRPGPGVVGSEHDPRGRKEHEMCVCTMLRNQARFLKEWIVYHTHIGVQRWFIYDNNSDDDIQNAIDDVMQLLRKGNTKFNITRHLWPWIKTQEAGFAHCALRARDTCEWVGFIDVDEFLYLPSRLRLHDVLQNQSRYSEVGEMRLSCHSFGPSGLKQVPAQGVMVGYTCRLAIPERHKSIVRPEAVNSSLINVVHHFHLRDGFKSVNVDRGVMVINHYKYQVWEVFKEKFYRRVAKYVADWQDDQNAGSKDRAPGLGTRAVEPPDWSDRFCEVIDTGLRDQVLRNLVR